MALTTNNKNALYLQSLVEEAGLLIEQLAAMDKRMEADILAEKGALAVWWEKNIEENKVASFMADRALGRIPDPREEALKAIFQKVFKTLAHFKPFAAAVLAPFESSRQPSYKMAYLDSQFGNEYFRKKERLEEIFKELFKQSPPSQQSIMLQPDPCARAGCWKLN